MVEIGPNVPILGELVALSGLVKGFWKNLGNFNPAKPRFRPVETDKSLF